METKIQLAEDHPDGPDGSDGSRSAHAASKENLDAETTSSKQDLTDISEKDPNNDVNITTGKNENPSDSRVEPSEPSEPSANPDRQRSQLAGNAGIENGPTYPQEASPPPLQFECYYCKKCFPSQSDLITHMDKESAGAREKQQLDGF